MKLTEHIKNIVTGNFSFTGIKTFADGLRTQGQYLTPYGKNYIINGGFDYWNYATSQTTSGYGSDDRWLNGIGVSTRVHSQVASSDTERVLFNSSKFSRTVVTNVDGTASNCYKRQSIENVTKLAGKTVTISFWAKADATKNISINLMQVFGTGGTPSAFVGDIGLQLVSLTSVWQKKIITITIPSIVGKTLGTDGVHTSATVLNFWFNAGSTYTDVAGGIGQQSGTFDIAEVKLEEGSVATPWTPYEGEFGGEVQACQRYFEKSNLTGFAYRTYASTSSVSMTIPYKVRKRATPTIAYTLKINDIPVIPNVIEIALDCASFIKTGVSAGNFFDISAFTASAEL